MITRAQFDARMDTLDDEERVSIIAAAILAYQKGLTAGYRKLDMVPDVDAIIAEWQEYSREYVRMMTEENGSVIDGEFVPWLSTYSLAFRDALWNQLSTSQHRDERKEILREYQKKRENRAKIVALNEVVRLERLGELTVMRGTFGVEWFFLKGGPRPCPFCSGYINMAYRWDLLPYYPPAHRQCVCTLIPISVSDPVLQTPEAATGTIDADIDFDYEEFYEDI